MDQERGLSDLSLRLAAQPTVNIQGLVSGYMGPGGKTVLPGRAEAKIDLRLVPDMTKDEAVAKLKAHLAKRGFGDIEVNVSGGYGPTQTDENSPLIKAEQATLRAAGIAHNHVGAIGGKLAGRDVHRRRRSSWRRGSSAPAAAAARMRRTNGC